MQRGNKGFTLIELLVVIAIISVLLAMVIPGLGRARARAEIMACSANLRQWGVGLNMYTMDRHGLMPPSYSVGTSTELNLYLPHRNPWLSVGEALGIPTNPEMHIGVRYCPGMRDPDWGVNNERGRLSYTWYPDTLLNGQPRDPAPPRQRYSIDLLIADMGNTVVVSDHVRTGRSRIEKVHRGEGLNALTVDGAVRFVETDPLWWQTVVGAPYIDDIGFGVTALRRTRVALSEHF